MNRIAQLSTTQAAKLSQVYSFVSSEQIRENLAEMQWQYQSGNQVNARKEENKGFQKHVMIFNHEKYTLRDRKIQLYVVNSHNGTTGLRFHLGVYRMVCANGLVSGSDIGSISIRHHKVDYNAMYDAVEAMCERVPLINERIEAMSAVELSREKRRGFYENVFQLAYPRQYEKHANDGNVCSYLYSQMDRHAAYDNNTVWGVFNSVQEKVMKGRLYIDGQKARPVKGLNRSMDLNKSLWEKAVSLVA